MEGFVSWWLKTISRRFPSIQGSQYRRAFCHLCSQPMRIDFATAYDSIKIKRKVYCDCCRGLRFYCSKAIWLTPRQAAALEKLDDE